MYERLNHFPGMWEGAAGLCVISKVDPGNVPLWCFIVGNVLRCLRLPCPLMTPVFAIDWN
eukprot:TRINITY_DN7896_c0_g1_i1.p2 TRINITY_DN7896_c0_g1~~TRINITY_DN7896_c0_g1_i1.p2  ORF type:complete len:60 (+),score=0.05 TRINITY_DN7896_c0_g1_i1:165-344(+)